MKVNCQNLVHIGSCSVNSYLFVEKIMFFDKKTGFSQLFYSIVILMFRWSFKHKPYKPLYFRYF